MAALPELALALGALAVILAFGGGMVRLGLSGGDRPDDAMSRILHDGDRLWVVVANRGSTPVIVGLRVRAASPLAPPGLRPATVIRPARRRERGPDWSDAILGAVPPGTEARWPVDIEATGGAGAEGGRPAGSEGAPASRCTRLLVAIGQPGRRLRIHDHLVVPAPPVPGIRPAGPFPAAGPLR